MGSKLKAIKYTALLVGAVLCIKFWYLVIPFVGLGWYLAQSVKA